ncbi:hypothetical protein MG296_10670 [Flavobacteriaceae bacterium TK19130]|nr:hypothetical protein [Thermobacterium salinum]
MKTTSERLKELRKSIVDFAENHDLTPFAASSLLIQIDDFENSFNQSERQPVTDNKGNRNNFYCWLTENKVAHSPKCEMQCIGCRERE